MNTATQYKVVLVNGNVTDLHMNRALSRNDCDVYQAPSVESMFGLLSLVDPDIILLDVEQAQELYRLNMKLKAELNKKTSEVLNLQTSIVVAMTDLIESRDGTTGGHIERTQEYLKHLVHELVHRGIYQDEVAALDLDLLIASAPLHDTGKIAIADSILNKPGKLTKEEFEEMKKHVDYGVEAIDHIIKTTHNQLFLQYAKVIAATHHEKWDGSGYPKGLAGKDIPLEGRLMAIADVYDALVSKRPYKRAFTIAEAEAIIERGRGTHFDPELVDVFHGVSNQLATISQNYHWSNAGPLSLDAA